MLENPWAVLEDIRPQHLTVRHPNPDKVPVLFAHSGVRYIGWQMRGALPVLFNCELRDLPGLGASLTPEVLDKPRVAPIPVDKPGLTSPATAQVKNAGEGKRTARLIQAFRGYSEAVTAVAFSPQSHLVLGASSDRSVRIWYTEGDWQKPFRDNSQGDFKLNVGSINCAAFSPDGNTILAGGSGILSIWLALYNFAAAKQSKTLYIEGGPPFRRIYFSVLMFSMVGWPLVLIAVLCWIGKNKLRVRSVSFSPDGCFFLASYNKDKVEKRYIFDLWEVATRRRLRRFRGHSNAINSIVYSPDARFALSGTSDGNICLWNIASGNALADFDGHTGSVNAIAFSKDGSVAVSGGSDKTLILWDLPSHRKLLSFKGHDSGVTS